MDIDGGSIDEVEVIDLGVVRCDEGSMLYDRAATSTNKPAERATYLAQGSGSRLHHVFLAGH